MFYLLISSIVKGLGYDDSINSRNLVWVISNFNAESSKETKK